MHNGAVSVKCSICQTHCSARQGGVSELPDVHTRRRISEASPCHTSPHTLFMLNMFAVNDSKYTGGCLANRLTSPLLHPLHSAVLWLLPATAGQSLGFPSLNRRLSVFCPKRINPSTTPPSPPASPFLFVVTAAFSQSGASGAEVFLFAARHKKPCATFTSERSPCLRLCAHLCMRSRAASGFRGSLTLSRRQ